MQLTENEIIDCVGTASYQRGQNYWRQRRVLYSKTIHDGENIRIIGIVLGSRGQKYSQEVELFEVQENLWIETNCSCPMGGDCKHIAAVLLEAMSKQLIGKETDVSPSNKERSENVISKWIKSTQHQASLRNSTFTSRPNTSFQLLYILRPGHRSISFSLAKARTLLKGGYGKPTKVALQEFDRFYPPNWCSLEDQQLCSLILSQAGGNALFIENDWGPVVLQRMLATGRCYWEDPQRLPFKPGTSKSLNICWEEHEQQKKALLTLAESEQWHCANTEPPYYIDIQNNCIGRLQTELPGFLINQLRQLPDVPNTQTTRLAHFLRHTFPALNIPLPAELKEKRIIQAPVPLLQLSQKHSREHAIPLARLDFLYSEHRLPPGAETDPQQVILSEKEVSIYITRQPRLEIAASNRLYELGFEHSETFGISSEHPMQLVLTGLSPGAFISRWLQFIEHEVPQLKAEGWQIEIEPDFDLRVVDADIHIEIEDAEIGWFDMKLDVEIQGQRFPLLPLMTHWLEQYDGATIPDELLVPTEHGWVRMPGAPLRPILSTLLELFNPKNKQQTQLKLPSNRATLLHDLKDTAVWRNAEQTHLLTKQLQNFQGIENIKPPINLQAELRPYQQEGLNWLNFLATHHFGGILADDMGLGKTLQALSFLMHEKQQGRLQQPALVIAPTSLAWNWRAETEKFAPLLKVLILHGQDRTAKFKEIKQYDIIITTYALLTRDANQYHKQKFSVLILDEAQYVKNPGTKTAILVRQISAEFRLCLTGTPLENHLGELWSIIDFALPGLLGSENFFRHYFRNPIEKGGDHERQLELNHRLAPFILRRSKQAVIKELPPKTEIRQVITLEKDQRNLYETIRVAMQKRIRDLVNQKGLARSHIEFLDALLKLRQACCDPRLVKLQHAHKTNQSAKLEWLKETLPELIEEGRKILLFSQFTSMLSLIEDELKKLNLNYSKLTGQTRKREDAIKQFQDGDTDIFLISLKAGGTGLNLTAADVVIHYDPWWNPAAEQQATDRAHRIGQNKAIFVYKLIAENTVEEKIQQMQEKKQVLASALYDENDQHVWQGSSDELLTLLD